MRTTASNLPGRRPIVLLGGLIAIVLWQFVFFRHGYPKTTLESPYHRVRRGCVSHRQLFAHLASIRPSPAAGSSLRLDLRHMDELFREQPRSGPPFDQSP
jgi:hypothetical protein